MLASEHDEQAQVRIGMAHCWSVCRSDRRIGGWLHSVAARYLAAESLLWDGVAVLAPPEFSPLDPTF